VRRALLLLVLTSAAACGGLSPEESAQRGHYDGLWTVVSISGKAAPADRFLIRVREGKVTGGRDGCNSWGFDATVPPAPDGARMIISDAQECAPTPVMRAYWRAIGNGNVPPRLTPTGELQLRAAGEEIIAERRPD
jgi:hypothetical protein